MNIFELFILAIGLSMDAFAVSVCKGLSWAESMQSICVSQAHGSGISGINALVGYFGGRFFADKVTDTVTG